MTDWLKKAPRYVSSSASHASRPTIRPSMVKVIGRRGLNFGDKAKYSKDYAVIMVSVIQSIIFMSTDITGLFWHSILPVPLFISLLISVISLGLCFVLPLLIMNKDYAHVYE